MKRDGAFYPKLVILLRSAGQSSRKGSFFDSRKNSMTTLSLFFQPTSMFDKLFDALRKAADTSDKFRSFLPGGIEASRVDTAGAS
jgi:hypothetical protein